MFYSEHRSSCASTRHRFCHFVMTRHSFARCGPQVCATYRTASFAPRRLHHVPSRVRAWPAAPWSPTPLRTCWRCGRAKRPLGADICGTRVSDFLETFHASVNNFSSETLHSARKPQERALLYPTYGAFLGAWIGVIPIGLDWDRPWQVSTGCTLCKGWKATSVACRRILSHPRLAHRWAT